MRVQNWGNKMLKNQKNDCFSTKTQIYFKEKIRTCPLFVDAIMNFVFLVSKKFLCCCNKTIQLSNDSRITVDCGKYFYLELLCLSSQTNEE